MSNLYDKADDYNVKIQVGEDSEMEIFKAHSIILRARYIYTGTIALDTINVENNFIELLLATDEMNLHELSEHIQQHIINLSSLKNNWIIQNGVKLFNTVSRRKGIFPKLEELCNNILIQEQKLLINSNEFWGLDEET
ncbi:hypothetical protein RclHR1_01980014 [Rhizophagus clarus]|nr:hypothetical protein RclHR1_01980014 [Rhizophagus clarus]